MTIDDFKLKAGNSTTPAKELAEIYRQHGQDEQVVKALAANPNSSHELLSVLYPYMPEIVKANPAWTLGRLVNFNIYDDGQHFKIFNDDYEVHPWAYKHSTQGLNDDETIELMSLYGPINADEMSIERALTLYRQCAAFGIYDRAKSQWMDNLAKMSQRQDFNLHAGGLLKPIIDKLVKETGTVGSPHVAKFNEKMTQLENENSQ
jgi:hypothetical protein